MDTPMLAPVIASVDDLEAVTRQYPQLAIVPVHRFADGLYSREITMPEGSLVTGKIHKTEHLCILLTGELSVWTAGEPLQRLVAPAVFVSPVGTRRILFAHTESTFLTVHKNPDGLTDIAAVEAYLVDDAGMDAETLEDVACRLSLPQ